MFDDIKIKMKVQRFYHPYYGYCFLYVLVSPGSITILNCCEQMSMQVEIGEVFTDLGEFHEATRGS